MTSRIGKIARIPYAIREQLNLRLLNGELGAPLLQWLNELPETKETLNAIFGGKPITKQNLSEWRHGGYQDWLRHQHRQERFQQMSEQGGELEGDEGTGDLFENFARLVLAEMAEDLNSLHEITDPNERWARLREISRDLARLQHSFNHSRKVALSFLKWKDEYNCHDSQFPEKSVPPPPAPAPAPTSTPETTAVAPGPTESNQKKSPGVAPSIRIIYHRRCHRGCVCQDCHPANGSYPYAQALKDDQNYKDINYRIQQRAIFVNADCSCACNCPEISPAGHLIDGAT